MKREWRASVAMDHTKRLPVTEQLSARVQLACDTKSAHPGASVYESMKQLEQAFKLAAERYAGLGVDVQRALRSLARIPISLHCWQGDDLGGFESPGSAPGAGLAVTGNCPGKARTPQELRADLEQAYRLIPGRHRLNLHAFYGEFGGKKIDRDEIGPELFRAWIAWARKEGLGLDFNPTCFAHPRAGDGFTLSTLAACTPELHAELLAHLDRGIERLRRSEVARGA